MITDLRIVYDGGAIDGELDDALRALLGAFGLSCWASGFNLTSDERDLAFERAEEKDE